MYMSRSAPVFGVRTVNWATFDPLGTVIGSTAWSPALRSPLCAAPRLRPEAVIGKAPATPGVIENFTEPEAPDPATVSGASTTFGVTTIGLRTVVPAPFQVRKPLAAWSNSALLLVKVTRNVRVSPAALNDR